MRRALRRAVRRARGCSEPPGSSIRGRSPTRSAVATAGIGPSRSRILTVLALAGLLDEEARDDDGAPGRSRDGIVGKGWRHVPQLPFELAAVPMAWYRWLRLPVVSYALPALIAIGQARHRQRPTRNPVTRLLRRVTRDRTLRRLEAIQPHGGGVPRGSAADQLRRHESRCGRGIGAPRGGARRGVPRTFGARRRELADRHESRHLGDDARRQRARAQVGPAGSARTHRADGPGPLAARPAVPRAARVHGCPPPADGPGPTCRAGCPMQTIRRARSSRCTFSERTTPSTGRPRAPASDGYSACRTPTAGSRRSAGAGGRCRSTAAART